MAKDEPNNEQDLEQAIPIHTHLSTAETPYADRGAKGKKPALWNGTDSPEQLDQVPNASRSRNSSLTRDRLAAEEAEERVGEHVEEHVEEHAGERAGKRAEEHIGDRAEEHIGDRAEEHVEEHAEPNAQSTSSKNMRTKGRLASATKNVIMERRIIRSFPSHSDGAKKLCHQCESLDLSMEHFVIGSQKPSIFHGEKPMGTYRTIEKRTSCPLCDLLIQSLGARFDPAKDGNPSCYLQWTVDGIKRDKRRTIQLTRRLQIVWKKTSKEDLFKKSTEKSYIVLVAPDGRFDARDTWEKDGKTVRPSTLFLGRLLTTVTDLVEDSFDLANRWLNVCDLNHEQCRAHSTLQSRAKYELLRSPSFAVVDVDEMRLVAFPREDDIPKYVAMSYTWGLESKDNKRFRCNNANIHYFKQRQGIKLVMKGLPLAIQDAISLTRKLKIRYIWVDSLCIIQDNNWSWENNSAIMDVIYGNATVTICAADNDSEIYGLKALSQQSDLKQGEKQSKYTRHAAQYHIDYRKSNGGRPIQLLLSHPSESYIAQSRWDQRGWTLQERLLSPRCLIFVDGRMYLQCRCTTMSEDIYSDDHEAIAGWSVELVGAPAQILGRLSQNPINVLKELVEMYTNRNLSWEHDILHAFKGITNIINWSLGKNCEMIYGLPNSHFDWALLWSSSEKLERRLSIKEKKRESTEATTSEESTGTKKKTESEEDPEAKENRLSKEFPSWSWCGWKEPQTRENGWRGGRASYENSTIFGSDTEFDLHSWLQCRTWITYYISNGQGRLRLVWDPLLHCAKEDIANSRGYQSPKDWKFSNDAKSATGEDPVYDLHGRPFDSTLPMEGRVADAERHFNRRLPTSHFKVVVLDAGHDDKQDYEFSSSRPYNETYLQFFTWSAKFYLVDPGDDHHSNYQRGLGEGLKRFWIEDRNGNLAGSCVLDEKYTAAANNRQAQEFIALSHARTFALEEFSFGGYYSGPDSQTEWQLYNVMMLEHLTHEKDRYGVGYRAGIGKMYKAAFSNGFEPKGEGESQPPEWFTEYHGSYWKEIVLG